MALIEEAQAYQTIEDSIIFVNNKYKADMLSYVIMPNHIHLIVYFKEKNELSNYMRDMKKFTSVQIRMKLESLSKTTLLEKIRIQEKDRLYQVWENRFDDLFIATHKYAMNKTKYIHNNPLQSHWKLVKTPEDYMYSSAQFYETGIQPRIPIIDYRTYF